MPLRACSLGSPSVCGFDRLPLPSCNPVSASMVNTCFPRSRVLPLRKIYGGCLSRTYTTASVSYPLPPLTLHASAPVSISAHSTSLETPQRSEEWFALRKNKLTTSTFSTALGFWRGNRRSELWSKKVFARDGVAFEAAANPVSASMVNTCFPRSRVLPLRKIYGGCLSRTYTTASVSYPSPPLTLHASAPVAISAHSTSSETPQRSEEWFALRKDKLTTSTFSTALGLWRGNRRSELWSEKVFARDGVAFEAAAKVAMDWGVHNEPAAIERYKMITGRDVGSFGFGVHAEDRFGWLGASPDGIVGRHPDGGVLEVKCPHNKGKPELGLPWQVMPYYYMPQVQGQMEIMNMNWADFYCWTPNGSTLFRVKRDPDFFNKMLPILHEFWWECVVPAREAVAMGREADARAFEPKARHPLTDHVIYRCRKLAAEAKLVCRDIGGHQEFYM